MSVGLLAIAPSRGSHVSTRKPGAAPTAPSSAVWSRSPTVAGGCASAVCAIIRYTFGRTWKRSRSPSRWTYQSDCSSDSSTSDTYSGPTLGATVPRRRSAGRAPVCMGPPNECMSSVVAMPRVT